MTDSPHPPPRPPRRRFQLSVRGLIVLVMAVGGALGWFEFRARVQREAVAVVKASSNVSYDLEVDDEGVPTNRWTRWLVDTFGIDRVATVVGVRGGATFDDAAMAAVSRLGSLERLELPDCHVTDAGMAGLSNLPRLGSLFLGGEDCKLTRAIIPIVAKLDRLERFNAVSASLVLTDADLDQLSRLPRLRDLWVGGPEITDRGLASLARLPALDELLLAATGATEVGLGHLSRCKTLRLLSLDGARATTLEPLRDLPNLAYLSVKRCPLAATWTTPVTGLDRLGELILSGLPIDDAGLAHIGGLPGLRRLDLEKTGITDLGLAHVARCAGLVDLDVSGTAITTLEPIRDMPRLEEVNAGGCPIAVAWRTPPTGLGSLCYLNLDGALIAPGGLAGLRDLDSVSVLCLSGSKVDDAGLADVCAMKGLTDLRLSGTAVGDGGVPHLLAIPGSPRILLMRTRLTDAGLLKLAAPGGFRGSLQVGGPSLTEGGVRAAQMTNPGLEISVD